jgi:hypothetical protein
LRLGERLEGARLGRGVKDGSALGGSLVRRRPTDA